MAYVRHAHLSPAGPTDAAVQGTRSPECPNHPQERIPRTGGDGEKQGREVRPRTQWALNGRGTHYPAVQASCTQCLSTVFGGQSSRLRFSAGDPGRVYTHIHSKGQTESGLWAPGPPQPQGAVTPQLPSRTHRTGTHPPGRTWQCTWAGRVQAHSRRPFGPRPQPSAWSPAYPASRFVERRLGRAGGGRGWFSGSWLKALCQGLACLFKFARSRTHSFIHSFSQLINPLSKC